MVVSILSLGSLARLTKEEVADHSVSIQGHYQAYLAFSFFLFPGSRNSLPEHGGTTKVHLENGQHLCPVRQLCASSVPLSDYCLNFGRNWRNALHICERLGLGQKRVARLQMGSSSCTWLHHHQDV